MQSLGTGKSRAIQGCRNTVCTVDFVLRNDKVLGFPPLDPEIRNFLTDPVVNDLEAHARAIGFLKAVFDTSKLMSAISQCSHSNNR